MAGEQKASVESKNSKKHKETHSHTHAKESNVAKHGKVRFNRG